MLHNGKAQTGTAGFPGMALVHPIEPLKDPCLMLFRNADAGILYCNSAVFHGYRHFAVLFVVPDGIVAQIVDELISQLTNAGTDSLITVELHGGSVQIQGVQQLVYELIYNLCDNAIRYNIDGGQVIVSIEEKSVTVKDTGIGIAREHQSRVFERFYRVDKSHSRETGGTGLGLSIVKHAALQLGAKIELESKPNVGTTVTVNFQK